MSLQDTFAKRRTDSGMLSALAGWLDPRRISFDTVGNPTKFQVTIWGMLIALMVILSLRGFDSFQLGTYRDDANYVVLARSIVLSGKYGLINLPGQPGATQFPFGFPLLLSPFVLLFPNQPERMKILSLVATILNGTMLFWGWRWLNLHKSYWWSLGIVGLYALSLTAIRQTRMVMSEPVFTTFCLAAILLGERAARREEPRGWFAWMALFLGFAIFTRTVGVILLVTIFAYLLYVRGLRFWKQLALVGAGIGILFGSIVALTPVGWDNLLPSSYFKTENASLINEPLSAVSSEPSNSAQPADQSLGTDPQTHVEAPSSHGLLVEFLIGGIEQHLSQDIRQAVLPFDVSGQEQALADRLGFPALPDVLGYLISALVFLGLALLIFQRKLSIFVLFAFLYFGMLLLWAWQGPRLLYPILPELQFGFLFGVEALVLWVVSRVSRTAAPRLARAALGGVVIVSLLISVYKVSKIDDSRAHTGDLKNRTNWLAAHTSPGAVILSEEPQVDYLDSGRKTVPYPKYTETASQIEEYLAYYHVNYVLVAPAVVWQASYTPVYSDLTKQILPVIDELVSQNKLALVYASAEQRIAVYQTQP